MIGIGLLPPYFSIRDIPSEKIRTWIPFDDKLKEIPFIMVTAEAKKDKILEAVEAGVSNYIVKPFTTETLDEKLKQTFDS
jgi:CheY-like chemotaxis protein